MDNIKKLQETLHQKDAEIKKLKNTLKKERIESEETKFNLENIIALVPGNLYWQDTNNIFLGCNNNQAKLAGLKDWHEIIGKTNFDMPWGNQAEELNQINNSVIKTEKTQIAEEYAVMANGPGTYLSHKTPLRDKDGNVIGILGISLDITEKKKIEKELIAAKQKAEATSAAKSEFIANMAHDFRTPITGVTGMINAILYEIEGLNQKN